MTQLCRVMNTKKKILLVDDDADILEFLEYNLKKENYEVFMASNGKDALKIAVLEIPDLILLDVMMPGMDGIETCKLIRESKRLSGVYIIFLTARIEEYSEIAGFGAGANDYINKPIKPGALISRLKSVFSYKNSPVQKLVETKNLRIDKDSYELTYEGKKIQLARKEFELLFLLASAPGQVFSRDKIMEEIWGNDAYVGDRTIDVHVRRIREKLNSDIIKTFKGVGYKYEE